MQLYTAYKVKMNPQFGNFSGTGMEKTLSANLASRVIDSKVTLIVCPNDVVEQWKNVIRVDQWNNTVYLLKESRYVRLADTMLRVLKHARIPLFLHKKSNHIFTIWQTYSLTCIKTI